MALIKEYYVQKPHQKGQIKKEEHQHYWRFENAGHKKSLQTQAFF
jgi:hypothetical protein